MIFPLINWFATLLCISVKDVQCVFVNVSVNRSISLTIKRRVPESLVRKRSAIDFRMSPALEVSCYQCDCCVIWVEKITCLSWPDWNFTYFTYFLTQWIAKKLVCKISKRPMTKVSFPMLSESLKTTFTTVSLNDVSGASELSSKKKRNI